MSINTVDNARIDRLVTRWMDEWEAEHDRQVAEKAWDEAWDYIGARILQYVPEGAIPLMPSSETIRTSHQFEDPNPYRRSESCPRR